jgi:hypothetical protein
MRTDEKHAFGARRATPADDISSVVHPDIEPSGAHPIAASLVNFVDWMRKEATRDTARFFGQGCQLIAAGHRRVSRFCGA